MAIAALKDSVNQDNQAKQKLDVLLQSCGDRPLIKIINQRSPKFLLMHDGRMQTVEIFCPS